MLKLASRQKRGEKEIVLLFDSLLMKVDNARAGG